MKKTVLTISALALALTVSAQSMSDGLMFSRNNYVGTARSTAMGNAVTALGGDLGGIGINPAGSAVAPYGQVTITPGLNIGISTTQGTPLNGEHPYFQRKMKNTNTVFTLPNIGFSLNWDTYATRGLKSFTFGFVYNQSQAFNERTYANGTNSMTSFMGSLATNAHLDGFDDLQLGQENSWDNAPWDYVAAMQGALIAPYFDPSDPGKYMGMIGASEKYEDGKPFNRFVPGELDQYYGRENYGSKEDYTFNFGMNFNDRLWLGINLNINSINFSRMEYMKEVTVDENDFGFEYEDNQTHEIRNAYLYEGKLTNTYRASGIGFSTKIGVIWNPYKGLRLGAAIQTPTWDKINEEWTTDASTRFSSGTYKAESPLGKYSYKFREPMRANFGLAYVFGERGLISVDYELAAYDQMKFTSYDAFSEEFRYTNMDIKDYTGIGHNLRIGGEIKIVPTFSVRAGYNLLTSGEYAMDENRRKTALQLYTHSASFGIGYSSKGSFFMDLAAVGTFCPNEYILPYREYVYQKDVNTGEYLKDANGYLIPDENFLVPEIENIRNNWKVILTLGFRF